MPSRTQTWRRALAPPPVDPREEPWVTSLHESLSDHIRLLAERRHTAFGQAATHRREGHLVPLSLTQELAENASELSGAMERYRKGRRPELTASR